MPSLPGHIAKAEKELAEYIKKVDVVVEVRDSRIPLSTAHPLVSKWIGNRPHLVAMMRTDQASHKSQLDWKSFFSSNHNTSGAKVYFVEGKLGRGIDVLKKHILREGKEINAKRKRMGIISGRPVRAAVIGYPNVGKSSLINRLLKKKMARVRNVAGHTRSMQWLRLGSSTESGGNTIEMLDSPGIIPAKHVDQYSAMSLAICNDIGQAAYENQDAAMALFDRILAVSRERRGYVNLPKILARYDLQLYEGIDGDDIVRDIADRLFQSSLTQAADKVLGDFRRGYWGCVTLEAPPVSHDEVVAARNGDCDGIGIGDGVLVGVEGVVPGVDGVDEKRYSTCRGLTTEGDNRNDEDNTDEVGGETGVLASPAFREGGLKLELGTNADADAATGEEVKEEGTSSGSSSSGGDGAAVMGKKGRYDGW
jgi:ribosome biogenesis GTPase A